METSFMRAANRAIDQVLISGARGYSEIRDLTPLSRSDLAAAHTNKIVAINAKAVRPA
jgi:hypothetical protein